MYALLSMFFSGMTSFLSKFGMESVNADLGLVIRTTIIFLLVVLTGFWGDSFADIPKLTQKHFWLLLASGITAFLSWLYYFRALKDGLVSYVATIDKASIVVTLALSFIFLKEPLSPKIVLGGGLVLAGMLLIVWK